MKPKKHLSGKGSNVRSWSYKIKCPAFGLVVFLGIISILGSAEYYEDRSSCLGSIHWQYDTGGYIYSSPAIGDDGTIYVGSGIAVCAIHANGTLKWRYSTGDRIDSSPAIGNDGTIYVGSSDKNLYAINPDGSLKWSYATGDMVRSSPAIGNDGTIYMGSDDKNLYAINPDGSLKWSYATANHIYASPAIGCDGTIYLQSSDGIHAINPDGSRKWSGIGPPASGEIAIGYDGTIYAAGPNYLYSFDSEGREQWKSRFPTEGSECGTAIARPGVIYASAGNALHAFSSGGDFNWCYYTGSVSSSPTIGRDGTIYVGSNFGILYALKGGSAGPAYGQWPVFHQNIKHTGLQSWVPANVSATAGDGEVAVSWEQLAPPCATSYNLYWSTSPGVTTSSSKIPGVTSPYFHTGLTNNITYYYALTAQNTSGESGLSREVSATPRAVTVPSAPTNVSATGGISQATVRWDPVSGAASYNLYWSTSPGVTTSSNKISNATSPYIHTGLTNDTTYYYAVTAQNTAGESGLSSEVNATPRAATTLPSPPTNISATGANRQTTIGWDPVSGATSYNIYWSTSPGVTTLSTKISVAASPYAHTGLTNDTTYYYAVTAENASGESGLSGEVNAMTRCSFYVYYPPAGAWSYPVYLTKGGYCPAMTLDNGGCSNIIYSYSSSGIFQDLGTLTLKYMENLGPSSETIDAHVGNGFYGSLAAAPDGNLHASYGAGGELAYAVKNASTGVWTTGVIDDSGGVATSIALDAGQKMHISSYTRGWGVQPDKLQYATNKGVVPGSGNCTDPSEPGYDHNWNCTVLDADTGFFDGSQTAIAAAGDDVHIVYFDGITYDLNYATNASGSWIITTIDSVGNVGAYPALALDASGNLHVSYMDSTNGKLKYATNKGVAPGSGNCMAGSNWNCETVDSGGGYTSIAVNATDRVFISHVDYRHLKCAKKDPSTGLWSHSTAYSTDSSSFNIKKTAIAADANSKAHIVYDVVYYYGNIVDLYYIREKP